MGLIYVDTCLLIYFVERHPVYGPQLSTRWGEWPMDGFAISPLVEFECLAGPIRRADRLLQKRYEGLFDRLTTVGFPESVFLDAASLRGRFGLKTADALHLACAHHHGCSELWTHDDRLLHAGRGIARKVLS